MSNVFKYPNNADTNFISDESDILIGAVDRARTFLSGTNDEAIPYAKPYTSNGQRYSGLAQRTPELLLANISKYRTYYGVATGDGINGYPSYQSVYNNELVEAHFFQIQFRSTDCQPNATTGTLTIDCRRDSTSHPTVGITATDTHGMGNASFLYTDANPRFFILSGFDTSVATEWGNYLNGNTYYLKAINASQVEVYNDEDYTSPVNIGAGGLNWSSYTSGGLCKIESQITGDITTTTTFDPTTVEKGFGKYNKSVAISGDYIAVASIDEDSTIDNIGHVYVYNSSTGTQLYDIESPQDRLNAFGNSLAIAGDYLVVGCVDQDAILGGPPDDGHVYVYDLTDGSLLYTFTGATESVFGCDVAAHGDYVIIGARRATTASTILGKAFVYNLTTGALVHTLENPDPYVGDGTNDQFGQSVTINATYAIVGAPNEDVAGGIGNNDGQVYVFNLSTASLTTTLAIAGSSQYGQHVAADGNTLVVSELTKFHYYNMSVLPFSGLANIGLNAGHDTLDCDGIYAVKDNEVWELGALSATLVRTLTGPFGTTIGDSSAIDADTIVCASDSSDRVFVFQRSTGNYLFELIPATRSVTTTEVGLIGDQPYTYQLISATLRDEGNRTLQYYDKDYYSGYTNLNNDQFGEYLNGGRPQFYVFQLQTHTGNYYASQTPIDYESHANWFYDSEYNPDLQIVTNLDGQPTSGGGGYVTGVTFNPELGGLMAQGGSDTEPYRYGALTAIKTQPLDSDPTANFTFNVSNITKSSPGVVTFDHSSRMWFSGEPVLFTNIGGMTELNGTVVYCKPITHNTIELYTDSAYTTPLDTSSYTTYTSGGRLQDYDNNKFEQSTFNGANFTGRSFGGQYQNFAPLDVDYTTTGSEDQIWPQTVSPAKMDITVIQPTRKSYGQDLTRYTNSTAAYGYRLELTYNMISSDAWRDYDNFIKQMRGGSAPFLFRVNNNTDGGGYIPFKTNQATLNKWNNAGIRIGKKVAAGDTAVYFMGFAPSDPAVCYPNDVFFGIHTYRGVHTRNNVGFAGGQFGSNIFGEAIIRFTHPITSSTPVQLSTGPAPAVYTELQCQMSDDEVEYNWHPTGNFVSFKINLDMI